MTAKTSKRKVKKDNPGIVLVNYVTLWPLGILTPLDLARRMDALSDLSSCVRCLHFEVRNLQRKAKFAESMELMNRLGAAHCSPQFNSPLSASAHVALDDHLSDYYFLFK